MNNEKKFIKLTPFKMQVLQSFPFIDADFDAITNYELLCKVVDYLNKTVDNVNLLEENFTTLYNYVHDYFDNLDVQEEINNKLDEMAESGELTDIIAQYLGLAGVLAFNTVNDMKSATNLANGSTCQTLGFYEINDGGKAKYKVRNITNDDIVDNITIIPLNNQLLIAELITEEYAYAKQYGFKSDGTDNSSIADILFKNKKVVFDSGTYIFSNVSIDHDIEIIGNNTILKPTRTSNTNNRYNTLFSFSDNINVSIKDINFEGYIDVETQTGALTTANSLINVDSCNSIRVENCNFLNFDNRHATTPDPLLINRRAVLFTIHDTLMTYFINNIFTNLKGEELIYCIDNELNRTEINMDFINNKITNITTTCLDFIGNILNLKNNYYNFTYSGSCLNVYALYLFVENEEINGSYDSVYDNCEELYFRGINVSAKNIVNNAIISNTIFLLSAENCLIDNLINNNDNVNNCVRNYFNTNNSSLHKDCTNSILTKCFTKIMNSYLVAKHCVTSLNTIDSDYNLIIENSELKSNLTANTYLIYSAPMTLNLINNIIHLCITAGSGAPAVLYSRADSIFKYIKAINNKMINDTENQQRFLVGNAPDYLSFIGNMTNRANSIIYADLTNVKRVANYNYTE